MKTFVRRYIFGLLSTTQFYPLFKYLYKFSIWGMNIGLGGDVECSGEKYILNKFSTTISTNTTPVIFDVGANQGQFAQAVYQATNKQVEMYCFEPSKITFSALEKSLHGYSGVQLHNFGLGDKDEELALYADEELSGLASLYDRKHFESGAKQTELVKIKMLDDFCLQNGIDHIHYLKLDVEGHELSVLEGAKRMLSLCAIDWIQFEFGGCNIDSRTYFRDFFDLLSPNYHMYCLLRNGLAPIKQYHETLEIFTTTNFIARASRLGANLT